MALPELPTHGQETMWAVVLGAILATVGGLVATQLEGFIRRRERQRGAALLFGELLSILGLLTDLADDTRTRGDPYGPVTMRLLGAARRECDIYDRNREALYDLRDASIRARIHTLMVQMSLSVDGICEATSQIHALEDVIAPLAADDPRRDGLSRRRDELIRQRQAGFDFAVETAIDAKPLIAALSPIAKYSFEAHEAVARSARASVRGTVD